MNTLLTRHRYVFVLFTAVLLAAAVAARVRHDRRVAGVSTFSDLEQQARSHPDDVQAQLDWGAALDSKGSFDDADSAFKAAARLAPRDARPLDALAKLAMERHRADEAVGYVGQSVQLDPNNAAAWSSLGTLLSIKSPSAALNAYSRATTLDPNDAFCWFKLGVLEMNRNQIDRGMHALQRAAALNPNDLDTEIALGNAAQYNNRPTVAKVAFDRALLLKSDDPQALLGSANVTLQMDASPANLNRVDKQLAAVLAAKPSADAYMVRGHLNLLMHRYKPAIADLKLALSLDQHLADSHTFLTQAYSALGQKQLAQQESAAFLASSSSGSGESPPTGNTGR